MSARSITVSQTNFCDAMSHVNISSESNNGYDPPVPKARISVDFLQEMPQAICW